MIITVTLNASVDKTAFINNFQIGKINRFDKPIELAGGKGLNVTRTLKILGHAPVATGFLGGKTGEKLEILMDDEGIIHNFQKIKDKSRSCLAIIDNKLNTLTELNENGPDITDDELNEFYTKLSVINPEAKIVIISGSIPKNLPKTIYYDLINICKERGLLTVLDATGEELKKGIEAKPFIIKPNKIEAEELLGFRLDSKNSLIKGLKHLCNYCNIACITLEDKGCVISNNEESFYLIPPQINLINSVGSGDAFMAGLVHALTQNESIKEMGKWGISCGSANAMTDRAGFCNIKDVMSILTDIEVRPLR